jgi:hypothetical protein
MWRAELGGGCGQPVTTELPSTHIQIQAIARQG